MDFTQYGENEVVLNILNNESLYLTVQAWQKKGLSGGQIVDKLEDGGYKMTDEQENETIDYLNNNIV